MNRLKEDAAVGLATHSGGFQPLSSHVNHHQKEV